VSSKVFKWDFFSKFGKNWMKKMAFFANGLKSKILKPQAGPKFLEMHRNHQNTLLIS
jgi:hypothetical protein